MRAIAAGQALVDNMVNPCCTWSKTSMLASRPRAIHASHSSGARPASICRERKMCRSFLKRKKECRHLLPRLTLWRLPFALREATSRKLHQGTKCAAAVQGTTPPGTVSQTRKRLRQRRTCPFTTTWPPSQAMPALNNKYPQRQHPWRPRPSLPAQGAAAGAGHGQGRRSRARPPPPGSTCPGPHG